MAQQGCRQNESRDRERKQDHEHESYPDERADVLDASVPRRNN
jgi:hypothetical protein